MRRELTGALHWIVVRLSDPGCVNALHYFVSNTTTFSGSDGHGMTVARKALGIWH